MTTLRDASLPGGEIKSPTLVILPFMLMVALTLFVFVPWSRRVDLDDRWLTVLCLINAAIWWVTLYWSLHHLGFKLVALFLSPVMQTPKVGDSDVFIRFAILYATCDDFQSSAAHSCVTQDYPSDYMTFYICDDSSSDEYRGLVDQFEQEYPGARVLRRSTRQGFKAGNLNHALQDPALSADWVIILDADQVLPQSYLRRFSSLLLSVPENVAYVQARQFSDHPRFGSYSTRFQQAIGYDIDIFYTQDMVLRTQFGFLPLIGHGAAIRHKALQAVPFPEVVSEDFALSLELRNQGWCGAYAPEITSYESFPQSFSAFDTRFRKFSGGTAELMRRHLNSFLIGPATFTEKVDFFMMVGWYLLMPLVVLNGYLSAYVCHRLWSLHIAALHPILPYLFALLFLLNFPIVYSVTPTIWHAIQHWAWSSAVYSACLPAASARFLRYFVTNGRPRFDRTPKDGRDPLPGPATVWVMPGLGCATLYLALAFYSPFSPVLIGLGTAYLSFPLYRCLNEATVRGLLARLVIWIPGTCYLWALWSMWRWQGI